MAEKNKVCTGCGEHQEESLAMELLREKKKDAKWWRIFAIVELAIIVGAICIVAYLFATTEVTYTELNPDGGNGSYSYGNSKEDTLARIGEMKREIEKM